MISVWGQKLRKKLAGDSDYFVYCKLLKSTVNLCGDMGRTVKDHDALEALERMF